MTRSLKLVYLNLIMNALFVLFLVFSGPDGAMNWFGGILLALACSAALGVMWMSGQELVQGWRNSTPRSRR